MKRRTTFLAMTALAAMTLAGCLSGCTFDDLFATSGGPRRTCDDCTAMNMGGSGFTLPQNGLVVYQGTVKVFDLDRRTMSFLETDPPLMRPHAATVIAQRSAPLSDADLTYVQRMTNAAWAPANRNANRGCASKDGRLPAMVVLLDHGKYFADYECGPEDTGGQLAELTARADAIVAQRFPGIEPK